VTSAAVVTALAVVIVMVAARAQRLAVTMAEAREVVSETA
jgi:hypothetical protein